MSGTDPDPRKSRPLDSTQAYVPPEAQQAPSLPANLPRIPGITLHFELARGGMGVVYSGRQDFLDRRVAVKLLSVELGGESFVQRFQREAKILAGIKHPNIVACHMAGTTDDGQSYLVMEFIDGPSLKKWIADHGPVSVPATLRLMRATAQALAHAHSLGIIHRDVKPENILLETVTSTALDVLFPFTPKVVDLGLARANEGSASLGLTSPGSVMGTPATMSPEQYDEPDAVDFRSDIYGLGCVFYEMLVGQPAFRGKKLTDIVTQKRAPVAPNPCDENLTVPPAVGALVQSMLASHRDDRPRSYKELDERLLELIETLTVSRTRSSKKAPPPPVVGEETEWGKGPMVRPSSVRVDKTAAKDPATSPPKPGPIEDPFAKAEQNEKDRGAAKAPSAGLLRTSEINFLAEGLDAPAGPAKPAFEDLDATVVSKLPPKDPADAVGGVSAGADNGAAKANRTPVLVGIGAVVVLAIGGYALSGGGGSSGVDPKGNGATNQPDPARPTIASIDGVSGVKSLGERFVLTSQATAADGGALDYEWSVPEGMIVRDSRSGSKITLEIEDGLPGVLMDVGLHVEDGAGRTTDSKVSVEVGDVPYTDPLAGFERNSSWKIDQRDATWIDSRADDYVACNAKDRLRTLTTSLKPYESYWEWTGALTSTVLPKSSTVFDHTPPALIGVRVEFGDVGYQVACTRKGVEETDAWSMDVHECRLEAGQWKATGSAVKIEFQNAEDDEEKGLTRQTHGWFQIQRRRQELFFVVGSRIDTFAEGKAEPTIDVAGNRQTKVFQLPADARATQLVLFVDKGRGLFRLKSR